jgi:hypothetical protein
MFAVDSLLVRRRLAGRVRKLALLEQQERHRGTIIEFGPMRARRELYEQLIGRIQDRHVPLPSDAVDSLEAFLAQDPPARDYGSNALARNERIAELLSALDAGGS